MMNLRHLAKISSVLVLTACSQNGALHDPASPVPNTVAPSGQTQGLLTSEVEATGFSGVVAIARNGKLTYASAHGFLNREKNIPNAVNTRFALASTSKLLTAIAMMQLAEDGIVALDAPVGRFLPDYPNKTVRMEVTIRHLIKMRSGLGDIFDKDIAPDTNRFETHADYIRLFVNEPLAFEPGTGFAYSNAGYILLGRVIEGASGQDFYSYIAEHILEPVGMRATGYDHHGAPAPDTAIGYRAEGFDGIPETAKEIEGRSLVPNTGDLSGRGTAAGGGYSTVGDFAKLDHALRSNSLITQQSVSVIFGEGFARGERAAGIAGGAPGTSTRFSMRPDGTTIIVLGNKDLPSAPAIASLIAEHVDRTKPDNEN